jgi:FkbM family methyltransferase
MIANFGHKAAAFLKKLAYGRRGEPYRIRGQTLRYLPGTRPIRLRYLHSTNEISKYDALQVQWLSTQLKEGDTAIDIGAHYGVYSILMAAMCGQTWCVVAFEPDPYAREVLEKNLSLNPGLRWPVVESCACSDSCGEAMLFSRGGNSQSSLARSAVEFAPEQTSEQIRVPLVTLDSYIAEHKLAVPRWVKIDPEGAEIRILKGAPRLLSSDAGILCELHPYAWPEFGNTFAELKDIVSAAGRRIRYIDQDTEIGNTPKYGTVLLERRP